MTDRPNTGAHDQIPEGSERPHLLVNSGPGGNLDLDNVFTYHAPFGDQVIRYAALRNAGWELARLIASCPPSPERSTAIAKVREAVMWANASIACHEKDPGLPEPGEDGVVHWLENHAMVHAVPDSSVRLTGSSFPAEVTCKICLTHLRHDPMPRDAHIRPGT